LPRAPAPCRAPPLLAARPRSLPRAASQRAEPGDALCARPREPLCAPRRPLRARIQDEGIVATSPKPKTVLGFPWRCARQAAAGASTGWWSVAHRAPIRESAIACDRSRPSLRRDLASALRARRPRGHLLRQDWPDRDVTGKVGWRSLLIAETTRFWPLGYVRVEVGGAESGALGC
jgi:hypothetical protein